MPSSVTLSEWTVVLTPTPTPTPAKAGALSQVRAIAPINKGNFIRLSFVLLPCNYTIIIKNNYYSFNFIKLFLIINEKTITHWSLVVKEFNFSTE
jgi:hypothetical protein